MATDSRSRADGLSADELATLLDAVDPVASAGSWMIENLPAINAGYLTSRLIADGQSARAARLAMVIEDPSTRALIQGLLAGSAGDAPAARDLFLAALAADTRNQSARFALLEPELPRLARDRAGADVQELAAGLTGSAASVVRGWRLAAESDWPALAALDNALARARPTELWYPHAVQLRADWRTKVTGDPLPARDAIRLIDQAVAIRPELDLFVLRAAAADVLREIAAFRESSRYATELVSARLGEIEAGQRPVSVAELEMMFRRVSALRGRLVRLSAPNEQDRQLDRDTAALSDRMGEELRRIQILRE
jgi:hypothetical protein